MVLLRPSRHFVQQASDRCFKTTEQLYFTSYICFLRNLTPFDPLYDRSRKIERERGQRIGNEDEKRKKGKRGGKKEGEKREKGQRGWKDEDEIEKKKQRGGEDENEKRKKGADLRGKMRMRKGSKEQVGGKYEDEKW